MTQHAGQAYLKAAIACLIVFSIPLVLVMGLHDHMTPESLRAHYSTLVSYYAEYPAVTITAYIAAYIIMTALSIPGGTVMMLIGGAIFGLIKGIVIVSFASATGGTLAFLTARFLARDYIQRRFPVRLSYINREIEKDGAFYLLSLRLVPAFPYFLINLIMGLTPIRTAGFFGATIVGMLPVTIVYVNAGTRLASIRSLDDILSPAILISFLLLAIFPWIARWIAASLTKWFKNQRQAE